jgi:hypothetical protein
MMIRLIESISLMAKRPVWSTPRPRPITIPQVMTLKTLPPRGRVVFLFLELCWHAPDAFAQPVAAGLDLLRSAIRT